MVIFLPIKSKSAFDVTSVSVCSFGASVLPLQEKNTVAVNDNNASVAKFLFFILNNFKIVEKTLLI